MLGSKALAWNQKIDINRFAKGSRTVQGSTGCIYPKVFSRSLQRFQAQRASAVPCTGVASCWITGASSCSHGEVAGEVDMVASQSVP